MVRIVLLLMALALSGCAHNKIFLHTYEIDEQERDKIVKALEEKEFEVIVSDRVPPLLQMGSFIIYPRDSRDNAPLAKIFDAIGELGYYTNLIARNRVKNHSYTKKTNIGLYLINPGIDWKSLQEQSDLGFSFGLTDVTFSSTDCRARFSLELTAKNKGTIRQSVPETGETLVFQWQQDDDTVSVAYDKKTHHFALEKDYLRKGNRNDLLLTLSPGSSVIPGLAEPFSCIYESRIPLVD